MSVAISSFWIKVIFILHSVIVYFLYRFGNFIIVGRGAEQIVLKSVSSFHDDFALNVTNVAINVNKKVDLFIT